MNMKNLMLSSTFILLTSFSIAQSRGGRNVNFISNVDNNNVLSNGFSNVSNLNQSNIQNRGLANNVLAANNSNISQQNKVVSNRGNQNVSSRNRTNPTAKIVEQRDNVQVANNPVRIQSLNNSNVNTINYSQQVVNVQEVAVSENIFANDNVANVGNLNVEIPSLSNEKLLNEKESNKVELKPSFNMNVAIDLPKPNITIDLKVKEEKVKIEKTPILKVEKGTGISGEKKKINTKSKKYKASKGYHYYKQNVKFATHVKNTLMKLKRKITKKEVKKPVFSVVCYQF